MSFFIDSDIENVITQTSSELNYLIGKRVLISGGSGFLGRYFNEVISKFNSENKLKIDLVSVDNFSSSLVEQPLSTGQNESIKFNNVR